MFETGKRKRSLMLQDESNSTQRPSNYSGNFFLEEKDFLSVNDYDQYFDDDSEGLKNTPQSEEWSGSASDARPLQQLRTSVRVQNKQRKEETKEIYLPSEEFFKKVDGSSQDEEEEEDGALPELSGDPDRKKRRAWELWSTEDKNIFFEAINECGKDFESIQNYLTTKLRRRGNSSYVAKNKDQVRHFYYRTWHKISKHVKFSNDVKKATQELYALINYGELRKKVGGTLNEKKGQKLQELIHNGNCSVKVKGKNIRVRTPICRALKRLNDFQDERDQMEEHVPANVAVELVAGSLSSFYYVQSLAHNPRLRIQCSLHKPLSKVIAYLDWKWRGSERKICERLNLSPYSGTIFPHRKSVIHLRPSRDEEIKMIDIQPGACVKSSEVSLQSHELFLRKKGALASHHRFLSKPRRNSGDVDDGSDGEEEALDLFENESEDEVAVISPPPPAVAVHLPPLASGNYDLNDNVEPLHLVSTKKRSPQTLHCRPDSEEEIYPTAFVKEEEEESMDVLHQLRALETVVSSQEVHGDDVVCIGEKSNLSAKLNKLPKDHIEQTPPCLNSPEELQEKNQDDEVAGDEESETRFANKSGLKSMLAKKGELGAVLKSIRKGWTIENCNNITVGELYLMFGKKKKLLLEYEFEDANSLDDPNSVEESSSRVPHISFSSEDIDTNVTLLGAADREKTIDASNPSSVAADDGSTSSKLSAVSQHSNESDAFPHSVPQSSAPDSVEAVNDEASNLSKMLLRLLNMAKTLHVKSEPLEGCICGFNPSKNSICNVRSPAASRISISAGRSPNCSHSPKTQMGICSPKVYSPGGSSHRSPSAEMMTNQKIEKTKPSSAKRLLPDIPEETGLLAENYAALEESQSQKYAENSGVEEEDDHMKVSNVPAVEIQTEFRIPIAPAPRNAPSNFNAQLTKLRQQRPSRRSVLRNMIVQRQLPLLSKTTSNTLNLKVLMESTTAEDVEIIADPVIPALISSSIAFTSINNSLPLSTQSILVASDNANTINNTASAAIDTNTAAFDSIYITSTTAITTPTLTTSVASGISTSTINTSTAFSTTNAASATITTAINTAPTTTITNTLATATTANAISVDVSGCHLLTVELPTFPKDAIAGNDNIIRPVMADAAFGNGSSLLSLISVSNVSNPNESSVATLASGSNLETTTVRALPVDSLQIAEKDIASSSLLSFSQPARDISIISPPPPTLVAQNSSGSGSANKDSQLESVSAPSLLHCLGISPPRDMCENSSSLLNTPKHVKCQNTTTNYAPITPIKLNISSLLASMNPNECIEPFLSSVSDTGATASEAYLQGGIPATLALPFPGSVAADCLTHNVSATDPKTDMDAVLNPSAAGATKMFPSLGKAFNENTSDKLMDITLGNSNSNSNFSTLLAAAMQPSFDGSLDKSSLFQTPLRLTASSDLFLRSNSRNENKIHLNFEPHFSSVSQTSSSPPSSPSRFLQHTDTPWLQSEHNDFSLSSLLGSIDSPVKSLPGATVPNATAFTKGSPTTSQSAKEVQGARSIFSISTTDNSVDFRTAFAKFKPQASKDTD